MTPTVNRLALFLGMITLMLTACSSGGADLECKEGICVNLDLEGPVRALEPVRFVITVRTEGDIDDLGVGIFVAPGIIFSDYGETPESAVLGYQDITSLDWILDTTADEQYTFSGHVVFEKPSTGYGPGSYDLQAYATHHAIARVIDFVGVYLDENGNQLEGDALEQALEATVLVPVTVVTTTPGSPDEQSTPMPPTAEATLDPMAVPMTAILDVTLAATATVDSYPAP